MWPFGTKETKHVFHLDVDDVTRFDYERSFENVAPSSASPSSVGHLTHRFLTNDFAISIPSDFGDASF